MPALSPSATRSTRITQIVLFAAFGLFLPKLKGVEFLDSVLLGAYTCLGVVFSAPAAAESKTVLRPVLNGLAWSWAMLISGILIVYATHNVVVGPDLPTVLECGIFGAALSTAVAAAVAWTAQIASETAARIVARVILLAFLVAFFLYARWLPDIALQGATISAIAATAFLLLRKRRA
jgi:hypothetical protein